METPTIRFTERLKTSQAGLYSRKTSRTEIQPK